MTCRAAVTVHDIEGRALPPAQGTPTEVRTKVGKDVLGFSLAGVQLKLSSVGNPNRQLSIPASRQGQHWIVKEALREFRPEVSKGNGFEE